MRRAYTRIREVPGRDRDGLAVLIGLAGRVAVPEADARELPTGERGGSARTSMGRV